MKTSIQVLLMALVLTGTSCADRGAEFIVSGYSSDSLPDIKLCRLSGNGEVSVIAEITCGDNPSFFIRGKSDIYYFVNEVDSFEQKKGGGITTYRIDQKNKGVTRLGALNTGAAGPCHIASSKDGSHLITANYGSGSVSVVKVSEAGIPEEVTDLIWYGSRSHPHMTLYNDRTRVYYITDLGLDRIYLLKLGNETGRLISADTPFITLAEGSGPRHMVTDSNLRTLYVINELNSTISVFNILPEVPQLKQTVSSLPEGFAGKNYCADIHISDNGKYLYASNRGDNTIAVFRISQDGTLSPGGHVSCGGNWPRNFALDKKSDFLIVANQRSDSVNILRIKGGGLPQDTGFALKVNAPACVRSE